MQSVFYGIYYGIFFSFPYRSVNITGLAEPASGRTAPRYFDGKPVVDGFYKRYDMLIYIVMSALNNTVFKIRSIKAIKIIKTIAIIKVII